MGHIGSKLIHSLRAGDYEEVILIDNLLTQRYCSIFNLPKGISFRFIEDDVRTANLEVYFTNVDAVIHLAAITNAEASFQIQEQVEQINYTGTARVARACIACGCKLVFISTTSVYTAQKGVVDERYPVNELPAQSPYVKSKLKAEQLLQSLGEKSGLEFVILRFGTIYGVSIGMRFHTAVNKFVWQACLGESLSVWRTALHQKRPYLGLKDAVSAINFILKKRCFDNQIYNVATDNLSVEQIITVIKMFIPDTKINFIDSQAMNQLSYSVSCKKFRGLGFNFKGNFRQNIKETIALLSGILSGQIR